MTFAILYKYDASYSLYAEFTKQLKAKWNVEDEGDLHDLLGIEFTFESGFVTLRQTKYIEKMCADFFPTGVPASHQANRVPCDPKGLPLHLVDAMSSTDAPDPIFHRRYQSLVGALLYCSGNTRPDVAYSVGLLCRAMAKPTPELYEDGLRVLGYLYRHRHIGLRYATTSDPLSGSCDSDWGVQHSISGWQFKYSHAIISWGSKKQKSVALSSCEAELMAASEAATTAVYRGIPGRTWPARAPASNYGHGQPVRHSH